jgi:peptidoglycan/xylan/chitin deacetylase (PgdA/CDA1 family)
MGFYLASYDTEAIYPWWQIGSVPYSARLYRDNVRYEGEPKEECLAGIRAVAEVHRSLGIPATFYLVGELVAHAGAELRSLLDGPLFDKQCHSYTHENLVQIADDTNALRHEIVDSKRVIEDTFGSEVTGFTTPGSFTDGLVGRPRQLELLQEAGYLYVRSVGKGPFDTSPAPLTQPFWYTQDGFPSLLELGLHGWHDNILSGQPFVSYWPPIFPWGYPSTMPRTAWEMYAAWAPAIAHVKEKGLLTLVPCIHPWSVYRVDRKALHVELMLTHARSALDCISCTDMYSRINRQRSLASEKPTIEKP